MSRPPTVNDSPPSVSSDEPVPPHHNPAPQGLLPVLKNTSFLALWSGQVFSQVADKIYLVLMIAIISSRFQTGDQTISGWVSTLMIVFTIPAVLFGFLAGVLVDRWPKRSVLVSTNLLRGILVLLLPLMIWATQGWTSGEIPIGFIALLGITFLVSTLTQFFAPAEQAIIPLIVKRKNLLPANSLYTTTMMAAVILGFALGEPLLNLMDAIAVRLIGVDIGKALLVGGCYLLAGGLLLLVNPKEAVRAEFSSNKGSKRSTSEDTAPLSQVWADMQSGLQYLNQQPQVRAAIAQLVVLFSVFAALAVLAVRLAEVMPAIESDQFGFLLAAAGVGMAIGAGVIGQFGQRFSRSQISLVGSIGMAGCLAGLALVTQQLLPTLVIIACLGLFAACVGIPMQTTVQDETPEVIRGKIFGLQNNAINIALSLPLALAGIAETMFGLKAVLLALSIMVILGGLLAWYSSRIVSKNASSPVS
ncbi:MAG: MFS transporter [Elainellaceae cyanobacterium]